MTTTPDMHCPSCGDPCRLHPRLGKPTPEPGDLAVCARCGACLEVVRLARDLTEARLGGPGRPGLRALTEAEEEQLGDLARSDLMAARAELAARRSPA